MTGFRPAYYKGVGVVEVVCGCLRVRWAQT